MEVGAERDMGPLNVCRPTFIRVLKNSIEDYRLYGDHPSVGIGSEKFDVVCLGVDHCHCENTCLPSIGVERNSILGNDGPWRCLWRVAVHYDVGQAANMIQERFPGLEENVAVLRVDGDKRVNSGMNERVSAVDHNFAGLRQNVEVVRIEHFQINQFVGGRVVVAEIGEEGGRRSVSVPPPK